MIRQENMTPYTLNVISLFNYQKTLRLLSLFVQWANLVETFYRITTVIGSIFGLDSYIDSRIRLQSNWFKSLINVFEIAKI